MRLIHIASIPSFLSFVVLTACVAKDPDSLGELETGNDSGGSSSGSSGDPGTSSEGTSAGSESEGTSQGSGDTGEPDLCPDPGLPSYYLTPCGPAGPLPVLPSGCYEPCEGPGSACTVGTCHEVQVDPCACVDGQSCCELCGTTPAWVCLDDAPAEICSDIVGKVFASVEELECGLGPKGPVLCNWSITFEESGDFLWQYSDVGQGGTYTCGGGVLNVDDPGIEVSYDPETGVLTWEGVEYMAIPTE